MGSEFKPITHWDVKNAHFALRLSNDRGSHPDERGQPLWSKVMPKKFFCFSETGSGIPQLGLTKFLHNNL